MPVLSLPSFLNKFLKKMAVEFRLSFSTYKFMPFDRSHSLKHFSRRHFTILLCFLDFVLFFKMELILEYRTPVRLKTVDLYDHGLLSSPKCNCCLASSCYFLHWLVCCQHVTSDIPSFSIIY